MKYITLLPLVLFAITVYISKSNLGDSMHEQVTATSLGSQLQSLSANSYVQMANIEKAHIMDVDALTETISSSKDTQDLIERIIKTDSALGMKSILETREIGELKTSSIALHESTFKLGKQKDFISEFAAKVSAINTQGTGLLKGSRLVTKELAKGRSSQGQIYYASNQTYLIQQILDQSRLLESNPESNLENAKFILSAAKQYKKTYERMLKGNENGEGKITSIRAYKILIASKRSVSVFMKLLSEMLGTVQQLSDYRSNLDEMWTVSNKIKRIGDVSNPRVQRILKKSADKYGMLDLLSIVFLVTAIVFMFLSYRKKINKDKLTAQEQADSFNILKKELGAIENGDLTKPLTVSHMHTMQAAKTINNNNRMFRQLIISIQKISIRLNSSIEPIAEISVKQAEIEKTITENISDTEERTEKLSKLSKLIVGHGNDYDHNHRAAIEGLQIVKSVSENLQSELKTMLQQSKSITAVNENISHGLEAATKERNKLDPLLQSANNDLINATLKLQKIPLSVESEELETILGSIQRTHEGIESIVAESRRAVVTTKQQSDDAVEQFEIFRESISKLSEVQTEIDTVITNQAGGVEDLGRSARAITENVSELYRIADSATTLVDSIKGSAKSSSESTESLKQIMEFSQGAIAELGDVISKYKVQE